jgi:hypothetical protein
MELKDLAVKHDFSASSTNYHDNDLGNTYTTWEDFHKDTSSLDIDLNLIFRWDLYRREEGGNYWMQIIRISQRKGIYVPVRIDLVEEKDVPQIMEFLKPHFEKMLSNWSPLSQKFLKEINS